MTFGIATARSHVHNMPNILCSRYIAPGNLGKANITYQQVCTAEQGVVTNHRARCSGSMHATMCAQGCLLAVCTMLDAWASRSPCTHHYYARLGHVIFM